MERSEGAKAVCDALTERLSALETEDAGFLGQLELSIARRAFGEMKLGAERMIDADDQVDASAVDLVHNHLNELRRALAQLKSGTMPSRAIFVNPP